MESFKDMHSFKGEDKKITLSLILALMPLMSFLLCQLLNKDSLLLHFIYEKTVSFPAIVSSESILLSKSMDVYCKTAPFLAVIVFVLFLKPTSLVRKVAPKQLAKGFISCCILLSCAFYFFMFSSFDLYYSSKILKLMSFNDYSLTFFYASLYTAFYMLTMAFLFLLLGVIEMIKER